MTKTMIGFFVFGCGGADVGFSGSLSVELDGAVDARVVMGSGGSAGLPASAGGRVNTGGAAIGAGGYDTSCGPIEVCAYLDLRLTGTDAMACTTDDDCCRGMECGDGGKCVLGLSRCSPENVAKDCPCGWSCNPGFGGTDPDAGYFCGLPP